MKYRKQMKQHVQPEDTFLKIFDLVANMIEILQVKTNVHLNYAFHVSSVRFREALVWLNDNSKLIQ